jgi:RimJ/RimL family protein N-acetyltransferase
MLNEQLKQKYQEDYSRYQKLQQSPETPQAAINVIQEKYKTKVYITTTYKQLNYKLESMEPTHAPEVFQYLNSQPIVREKYANGEIVSEDATTKRIATLSARFELNEAGKPRDADLHMYGGFVVYDADDDSFLGMCNLGGGSIKCNSEIAYLNRPDAWNSEFNQDVVQQYEIRKQAPLQKSSYVGLGTAEVYSLMQYAKYLKSSGYKINGEELQFVEATARIDNPGSWKAAAKAGMEAHDVSQNLNHSQDLRYQLKAKI